MSAQDLEQRARELLAAEFERDGATFVAGCIRHDAELTAVERRVIRAIVAALRQQPAPADVSEVTRQLIERDRRGRAKYGTSLDRTDLSLPDWLQHMAEELLDAAGYALAAKRTAQQPAPVVDDAAMRELIAADVEYDAIRQRAQRYPCPGMDEHVMAVRKRRAAAIARVQGVQS